MNFVELYLKGTVKEGDIDDFINDWHMSSDTCDLHGYLGFTWEQYARYVMKPSGLGGILEEIKNNIGE